MAWDWIAPAIGAVTGLLGSDNDKTSSTSNAPWKPLQPYLVGEGQVPPWVTGSLAPSNDWMGWNQGAASGAEGSWLTQPPPMFGQSSVQAGNPYDDGTPQPQPYHVGSTPGSWSSPVSQGLLGGDPGAGTPGPEAFGIDGNIGFGEAASIIAGLLGGPLGWGALGYNALRGQPLSWMQNPINDFMNEQFGYVQGLGFPGSHGIDYGAIDSWGGESDGGGWGGAGDSAMGGGYGDPDGMGGIGDSGSEIA